MVTPYKLVIILSSGVVIYVYFNASVTILSYSGSTRWPLLIGLRQDSYGRREELLWNDNSPLVYSNLTGSEGRYYVSKIIWNTQCKYKMIYTLNMELACVHNMWYQIALKRILRNIQFHF